MSHHYGSEYAMQYAYNALRRPYTNYKNDVVASLFARGLQLGPVPPPTVLDIGCNVNGVFKTRGLRHALGQHGMGYVGLDLDLTCFDTDKFDGVEAHDTYSAVDGVVGGATAIPFADETYSAITCNDVIEHIEDPAVVLREIRRVLSPGGQSVVIVPSMYKLDGFCVPHINDIRVSSHLNRFGLDTWVDLIQGSGLQIDRQASRPMGIASGLTYLLWCDQEFVPHRAGIDAEEEYSLLSDAHKDVKRRLGEHDALVDQFYLDNPMARRELMHAVVHGDAISTMYHTLASHVGGYYPDETMRDLLLLGDRADISTDLLEPMQTTMQYAGDLALGNSAVFVLNKSVE